MVQSRERNIMANHFRTDRVGMEIKREVNEILQKKVRDPRVQGVTITDVQMLGDLSVAKVYYTILSNLASDNQKAQIGLEKATGTIKQIIIHDWTTSSKFNITNFSQINKTNLFLLITLTTESNTINNIVKQ